MGGLLRVHGGEEGHLSYLAFVVLVGWFCALWQPLSNLRSAGVQQREQCSRLEGWSSASRRTSCGSERVASHLYLLQLSRTGGCSVNLYGSFLISVDAQRVSGAQEAPWCSLEKSTGWQVDSVVCGRGTCAGRRACPDSWVLRRPLPHARLHTWAVV